MDHSTPPYWKHNSHPWSPFLKTESDSERMNLTNVQRLGIFAEGEEVAFLSILEAIVVYSLKQSFVASGVGPVPCG